MDNAVNSVYIADIGGIRIPRLLQVAVLKGTIHCPLSIVHCPLSIVNCQLSTLILKNCKLTLFVPPDAIFLLGLRKFYVNGCQRQENSDSGRRAGHPGSASV